nr:hypothetical protein [uncultured Halomonas sp.]
MAGAEAVSDVMGLFCSAGGGQSCQRSEVRAWLAHLAVFPDRIKVVLISQPNSHGSPLGGGFAGSPKALSDFSLGLETFP